MPNYEKILKIKIIKSESERHESSFQLREHCIRTEEEKCISHQHIISLEITFLHHREIIFCKDVKAYVHQLVLQFDNRPFFDE